VDVNTDLAITGKPAQFGRGVIEDISNKLLQQFVTCLQDRVGASPADQSSSDAVGADEAPAEADAVAAAESAVPTTGSAPQAEQPAPVAAPRTPPRPQTAGSDEALDLGATVLPILARTYGPQAGIALLALLIGYLLGRRRS
jgi:hypothetical protein